MAAPVDDEHEATVIKVVTIITLGAIVLASVIGITITGIMTDRDLFKAEAFTFGGAVVLAGVGGFSIWSWRKRRRWHVNIDRENGNARE